MDVTYDISGKKEHNKDTDVDSADHNHSKPIIHTFSLF